MIRMLSVWMVLAALACAQSAPRHIEDWRVLPEPKPHHFSRGTKVIIVLSSIASGLVVARLTRQPHCDLKVYDGRPYSGVNVPCPKDK